MKLDFATEEEISMAQKLLLPPGKEFCEERRKIILYNETADINACPGSGKTTVLLAKLVILAKRLPLPANQGICVLTHTNVAINEIKKKLGNQSDILFRYPNHFGTIQSFVDKFLASPNNIIKYGKRLTRIGDSFYKYECGRFYYSHNFSQNREYSLRNSLYQEYKQREDLNSKQKDKEAFNLFCRLRIDYQEEKITDGINGTTFRSSKSKSQNALRAYEEILHFKESLFSSGIADYEDCYSLALDYINIFPKLGTSFSNRFKYVFIDEMQDTDEHQITILDKLFESDKVIIQRFGDPHQTIFNKVKLDNFWNIENELKITDSKRFGVNIAKVLRTVCIIDNNALKPNNEINSLQPHIILYNDPKEVLPKFCNLLSTLKIGEHSIWEYSQLPENKNKPIKAVGWVGKEKEESDDDKYNIQSYWQYYQKDVRKKDRYTYDSLKMFIRKLKTNTAKDYYLNFLEVFLYILSLAEKKHMAKTHERNFTKTTMLGFLKENSESTFNTLKSKIARWSSIIQNGSEEFNKAVLSELKTFIRSDFYSAFKIENETEEMSKFIDNDEAQSITVEQSKASNYYEYPENKEIKIELSTIHSAKGETHTATLLLETSYYSDKKINGYESERIMPQLKGEPYKNINNSKEIRIKETLKMAYVAMSRPTHFLCIAIHQDRLNGCDTDLENHDWKIIK